MNRDKLYFSYITYTNDIINIYDEKPDTYISKLVISRLSYKNKIIEDLYKLPETQSAKAYFNVLDLHSVHFTNTRLDRSKMLQYILPPIIEVSDNKLLNVLENNWNLLKKKKIKEITTNNILGDQIKPAILYKDYGFVFYITKQTPSFILSYDFPKDLSSIILEDLNDKKLIMNNFNRLTKKFHLYRRYMNGKIIPYINETHLIGYNEFTETFINDIYEHNIEISVNHPYDIELEKQFNELNINII